MTTKESLLQAVREWLKEACGLTDGQVKVKGNKKAKPGAAYLDCMVVTPDLSVGTDHTINGLDGGGAPTVTPVGERTAVVQIDGYGEDSYAWLETAKLSLVLEDIQDTIADAGFTFVGTNPVLSLNELLDTGYEARYTLEIEARYRVSGGAVTQVEATNVNVDLTLEGSSSLNVTISKTF